MLKLLTVTVACLALAGCYGEDRVKNNVECKTHLDQPSCASDVRCVWHDKDDGTFRCKGKSE
jgi:hypothetical protein